MNVLLSVLIVLLSTVLTGAFVVMLLAYSIVVDVLGKTKTAAESWMFDHIPHIGTVVWGIFVISLLTIAEVLS